LSSPPQSGLRREIGAAFYHPLVDVSGAGNDNDLACDVTGHNLPPLPEREHDHDPYGLSAGLQKL